MKKLIFSEVISVILILGIFLLVFTLLNGWEKTGRERYVTAVGVLAVAVFAAVGVAVFVAVAVVIAGALRAVAVVAFAAAIAFGVAVFIAAAFGVVVAVVVNDFAIAVTVVGAVAVVVIAAATTQRFDAPQKAIWLSLGAEAVAIIFPIILITFC